MYTPCHESRTAILLCLSTSKLASASNSTGATLWLEVMAFSVVSLVKLCLWSGLLRDLLVELFWTLVKKLLSMVLAQLFVLGPGVSENSWEKRLIRSWRTRRREKVVNHIKYASKNPQRKGALLGTCLRSWRRCWKTSIKHVRKAWR